MSKIKLNLSTLTITEKIAKARQIVTALTGNARFKTPSPDLPTVTTAITDLETAANDAQAARQTAKTKTTAQGAKEDAVDRLLTQLAGYVESVAGNDQEAIQSAGMDTRSPRTATTRCTASSGSAFGNRRSPRRRYRSLLETGKAGYQLCDRTQRRSTHRDKLYACGSFDQSKHD